jgi:N-acetylmuramoyl-L-alanine amidase
MKLFILFIVFLFGIGSICNAQKKNITIVIDAGHGGSDPGHLSADSIHLPEKALNLIIANKVGSYIDKYLTNINIVYTRTADTYVSLDDRVFKANSINADYFISIHCNANDKKIIHGTESHVHNLQSKKSVEFARIFEKEFSTRAGRHSRGVKDTEDREHSLQVLKYTKMTSVLIECGFLTNVKEANYLNTTNGQDILASAIFRGIRTFVQKEHPSINFIKAKETPKAKYRIQIMSSKEWIDTDSKIFKRLDMTVTRVMLNTKNPWKYIYYVGDYNSLEEANKDLPNIRQKGFPDALPVKTTE